MHEAPARDKTSPLLPAIGQILARPRQRSSETDDTRTRQSGSLQRGSARGGGRAGGYDVIHEKHGRERRTSCAASLRPCTRTSPRNPSKRTPVEVVQTVDSAAPGPPTEGGLRRARPSPLQQLHHGPARHLTQAIREHAGLVEAPLPPSGRGERDGDQQRRPIRHQPESRRTHRGAHSGTERRPPAVLESAKKLRSRRCISKRCRGSPQLARPGLALRAVAGHREISPARRAAARAPGRVDRRQAALARIAQRWRVSRHGDPAQGAPRRQDGVEERGDGPDDGEGHGERQGSPRRSDRHADSRSRETRPATSSAPGYHLRTDSAAWWTSIDSPSIAGRPSDSACRVQAVPSGP